ncbi:MAG TPA: hypothetical protein VGJ93_02210 [Desulfuromonadaceae bacterium]
MEKSIGSLFFACLLTIALAGCCHHRPHGGDCNCGRSANCEKVNAPCEKPCCAKAPVECPKTQPK